MFKVFGNLLLGTILCIYYNHKKQRMIPGFFFFQYKFMAILFRIHTKKYKDDDQGNKADYHTPFGGNHVSTVIK